VSSGSWALEVSDISRLIPGVIDDTAYLGAIALLRAAQRSPDELIVHHDLTAGVVGVRLFKDGEWAYEIIDDYLPCCHDGSLCCGRTSVTSEVWIALLEKANAKIHGSYEAVQRTTDLEALEDLTGGAVRRLERRELACSTTLARVIERRQQLSCLHLAARRRERRGEKHASGLLSGYAYPLIEPLEQSEEDGPLRSRLENPWLSTIPGGTSSGSHTVAAWTAAGSFDMDANSMLEYITEVIEVRSPLANWFCCRAALSTDRPCYPLLSARCPASCVLLACQPDRRWQCRDSYFNGLGLRVYRCRVRAPPANRQGARQDPKANPFEPLELISRRPLGKTRSACVEFSLEPYALYVVSVDSQYKCPRCILRFACSTEVQFRELSAPEAEHFLAAQAGAVEVKQLEMSPRSDSGDDGGFCRGLGLKHCEPPNCKPPAWLRWWNLGC